MTGKTHAACGAMSMLAITIATRNNIQIGPYTMLPVIGLISVVEGSYLPDIDLHRSKMGHRHKFISKMLTHRGITHTLLVPGILLMSMLWCIQANIPFLPDLIFGLNVGWTVHIIADLFNRKGVPILWPVTKKKLHVACFLTSSWHEVVFLILWGFAMLLLTVNAIAH